MLMPSYGLTLESGCTVWILANIDTIRSHIFTLYYHNFSVYRLHQMQLGQCCASVDVLVITDVEVQDGIGAM